jgi:neopullulanase
MKRKLFSVLLCAFTLLAATTVKAITITRVEPENWWVGMKNKSLQIMVYGPNIAHSVIAINYPGITIKQVAKVENPNYVFIYLTIAQGTKPGTVPIKFTDGKEKFTYNYPIKARTDKSGAAGFTAADVLYLITPDRFANGNTANDNWDGVNVKPKLAPWRRFGRHSPTPGLPQRFRHHHRLA